jgi:putative membrane protein
MFGFLIRLLVSAVALLFIAKASNGEIVVKTAGDAAIAALVLGLANALVKPVLEFFLKALTFPLSCLTLGLWSLALSVIVNGALFYVVARLVEGFDVRSFPAALVGALVLGGVNAMTSALTRRKDD